MRKSRWWLIGGLAGGIVAVHLLAKHRQQVTKRHTSNAKIRVLIVGAGVTGTTYAVDLARHGIKVDLLAHRPRLDELRAHGVTVRDILTHRRREAPVHLVSQIPAQEYDLAILAVPPAQIPQALKDLDPEVSVSPTIAKTTPVLIMQSISIGIDRLLDQTGEPSLLLGFPATEGVIMDGETYSPPFYLGSTIIGESDGASTHRLQQTASVLRRAGQGVQVQRHILPWLQTHTVMVAVLAACVFKNNGSMRRLARDPNEVRLYLAGLREAYQVLEASDIPVTPRTQLQVFERPIWLQTALVRLAALPPWMSFIMDRYILANRDALCAAYEHLLQLAERAGTPRPNLRSLRPHLSTSRH